MRVAVRLTYGRESVTKNIDMVIHWGANSAFKKLAEVILGFISPIIRTFYITIKIT